MPLIIKGEHIIKGVVQSPPSASVVKEEPVVIDQPKKYHEVHEGELHKMINTKSDYLRDALDLDINK